MTRLPAVRRFTVEEYYAMMRAGILREDDRVELLDGEVVQMPPIGARHNGVVDRLARLFIRAADDRVHVRIQGSVRLDPYSEPQPDVALLQPRADDYTQSLPRPSDVLLLIEVADTTVAYDRSVKLPLYARAGIPEVWIVDLEGGAIEVYRAPEGGEYHERSTHHGGDAVAPAALPDIEVRVGTVLA